MAKYELKIYGKDDVVEKEYATNICPFGVFIEAAELNETLKNKSVKEQIMAVGDILKQVFVDLTDEELRHADTGDVFNTFTQIISQSKKIKTPNSKNG
jgi:hypothetical protein